MLVHTGNAAEKLSFTTSIKWIPFSKIVLQGIPKEKVSKQSDVELASQCITDSVCQYES